MAHNMMKNPTLARMGRGGSGMKLTMVEMLLVLYGEIRSFCRGGRSVVRLVSLTPQALHAGFRWMSSPGNILFLAATLSMVSPLRVVHIAGRGGTAGDSSFGEFEDEAAHKTGVVEHRLGRVVYRRAHRNPGFLCRLVEKACPFTLPAFDTCQLVANLPGIQRVMRKATGPTEGQDIISRVPDNLPEI
jgi:hypothetical protein